ncbi:magnesium transporter MgtE N-terminal domain-containing protein [Spartinivicinus poritis]|uniref:CBS domain-containing protein n=1 Tax=Spartinivicinus poritis TaxID=2994640 RepID=A0ABT5UGN7_9GAMM|nr:CBS domain-containing protein [Spartinivicinus sp. A2-2]MDE1464652.1 CBS domain-containing protein [Spartinivicinus sp. A2-2]
MESKQKLALTYLERSPEAAAKILETMSETVIVDLLKLAPTSAGAATLVQLTSAKSIACLDQLDHTTAAKLVTQLSATHAATLLKGLSRTKTKAILHQMPKLKAQAIQVLLAYPTSVVGAWITPQVLTLRNNITVAEAYQQLKSFQGTIQHRLFILDRRQKLVGVIAATDVMGQVDEAKKLSELMEAKPESLRSRLQLSQAQKHPDWRYSIVMPVVNRHDEFIGVLNYGALNQAIEQLKNLPEKVMEAPQLSDSLGQLLSDSITGVWQTLRDAWDLNSRGGQDDQR